MKSLLCITIRFLQPYSHGRDENGEPEWPPSPLRVLQALVASSAGRWNERNTLAYAATAIRWLETLPPPRIVASQAVQSELPYRLYVPDNVGDKVAASWSRGRDATIADYRTEKDVRSAYLEDESVNYLYPLSGSIVDLQDFIGILTAAARAITHLGWGIDMAVGNASVITVTEAARLPGHRWQPSSSGGSPLRVPKCGTLDDLMRKHADFLGRLTIDGFRPVPPLRMFDVIRYRRDDQPLHRPYRVFELRNSDGSRFRYPHRRFIHIAGMVRHLAIEAMVKNPPRDIEDEEEAKWWVETYIAGHRRNGKADTKKKNKYVDDVDSEKQGEEIATSNEHRQLSYLPLPSIGHQHTDPGVRRVMIAAPVGDDNLLDHVARSLAGQILRPVRGDEFAGREPPLLVSVRNDNIARLYTQPANAWASITPVILPGHDDHKPEKTRKLIERALTQSGIDQPCQFEWGAFSYFPKSLSAHKYDRNKQPTGYIRPDHLLSQTAVHLKLRFDNELKVPGPLVIGAGRHCGFGLMAGIDD